MSKQKYIAKMTGYKATTANMQCTPKGNVFQFELGKWYECEGELQLCVNGFHFCVHPSGPWSFYNDPGTRIFKVEAEQVLDVPVEPGADFKLCAKRIRLVEEVKIGGEKNTGYRNTGDGNTGNWNTANNSSGMFCAKEPVIMSFDKQTNLTRDEYFSRYPEVYALGEALAQNASIDIAPYKNIPGITKKKLAALHKAHIEGRKKASAQ